MSVSVHAAAIVGIEALPIIIESDIAFGMPAFNVVGLPDAAVKESRERIRTALKHAGFGFPQTRITVNLAPADVRKQGPSFDLPIALSVLAAQGDIPPEALAQTLFVGELGLDSSIRPVRGALAAALCASRVGFRGMCVPLANAEEAASVPGLTVYAARTLTEIVDHVCGRTAILPYVSKTPTEEPPLFAADFGDVRGQTLAKRGLEIAAAGGHHTLLIGSPGAGKTMLARALPGILPPFERQEALEATLIASVAGILPVGTGLLRCRPLRTPHHSSSAAALIGGGTFPRPGEASLAHRGILFLDELPEFPSVVLEHLRQPLEDGEITVARVGGCVRFPARFLLIAAMNPCPCGHAGDPRKPCTCTPKRATAYRHRISGPLLDRFDLTLRISNPDPSTLVRRSSGERSADVRTRVCAARHMQTQRFQGTPYAANADIPPGRLDEWCALDEAGQALAERALAAGTLTARGYARIRKVARTIADLEGSSELKEAHLAEALQYRLPSLD